MEETKRRYIRTIGRRKTAVAQVHVFPNGKGELTVNAMPYTTYFPTTQLQDIILSPLIEVGQRDKLDISAKMAGGGKHGQSEALRMGIARALVALNENFRKPLRKRGFLTRDARRVERKNPGFKKARKSPQWAKR